MPAQAISTWPAGIRLDKPMIVWSLSDWEQQEFDKSEVESLLRSHGLEVDGWINNTPRLKKGTLEDAQRILQGQEKRMPVERAAAPKRKSRKRK